MSFIFTDRFDYKDTAVADAFRRLRVSHPYGVFNSSLQNSINPEDWEHHIAGTGDVTYLAEQSAAELSVGTDAGDRVLRQSKETFQYQTGTGTNVMMTGVLGEGKEGVSSRIGIYDDLNGVFFEVKDGVLGVVLRRTLSAGNTEEIRVNQQDFNRDKLDGTGGNEYNIDITKSQIFNIDYAWLGVGRVRLGVWSGNCFCICHEFNFNNVLDSAYMGKGDLPVRYEVINTATTASPTVMKQICAAVFVEGGLNPSAYSRAVFTAPNQIYRTPSTNDWYNLLTIRIKSGQPRTSVKMQGFNIYSDANTAFQIAIIKNGNLPTLTWLPSTDYTEYARLGGIVTGGVMIFGATGGGQRTIAGALEISMIRDKISLRYDGTSETFSLAIRRIAGEADVAAAMSYLEFR